MFMCESCDGYFDSMQVFKEHQCYLEQEKEQSHQNLQQEQCKNCIWSKHATLMLIETYRKYENAVKSGKMRKKIVWDNISTVLKSSGYTITGEQVAGKWKSLTRAYKNVKDHNNKSGNDTKTFEYEEELDTILKYDPVITPKFTISSSSASSSSASSSTMKRPRSTSPSLDTDEEIDDNFSVTSQCSEESGSSSSKVIVKEKPKSKHPRRSNGNEVVEVFKTYVQDQKEEWKKRERMHEERLDVMKSLVKALTKSDNK
ncbi:trihelix transcription factor GT-3b-like [Pecten maximus]|uniref:trihelix transcription factor GT-3b-like n=1 Tax=Pecten maximus TaxID=6579 RepID=UPI001458278E|nr:trihelix transcription factor GT-3b-like [Pecten maximus]